MESKGFVSLWVGHFKSAKEFQEYLLVKYNEDGDAIPSEFEKEFKIEYYDEDFKETHFYNEPSQSFENLLEGFSYDNVIIPKFLNLNNGDLIEKVNSIVLLYDFKYDGTVKETRNLKYIGSVDYK
ncbi:immunity 22 family protein [Geobacillus icigianus]|uniref:Immunity protein 22 n=2 Tax=Geobacillus TaxID=129337 RepID=A0A679FLR2_9BACL|nr:MULTISPECIES: immunity 22 family protein [Geobacillus]MEB3751150.1 hypothetical protein [Geobacillus icigianus]BBW97522.1 hypothetical protein GsuE55_23550 [Geobacillus subterraneus]